MHPSLKDFICCCADLHLRFVAETAMFSTDCAEDENDSVVREAHKLENALECGWQHQ
ncbi:hypothetical protein EDD16DRAFT_1473563 [Pisolithus croceorrhizus]|nr:hypothetical protein EV401DRAFT_1867767 [Pisolithus croceorrhizus]KAI6126301.1 hypothetical protein EDD16DRAFT_1473563 [Pisolithus croceorrhizus]